MFAKTTQFSVFLPIFFFLVIYHSWIVRKLPPIHVTESNVINAHCEVQIVYSVPVA